MGVAAVSPRAEASPGLLPRARDRLLAVASEDTLPIVFFATVASIWLMDLVGGLAADSWLTLLGGREVVAHGIPHRDTLTVVSHGKEWVDQQWLSQLFFYGLFRVGGLGLVVRVNDALFLIPLALCLVSARRRGGSPSRVALIALPALLFTGTFVRAQALSQLLFVLLLFLLLAESRRPSRRIVLAFPLLALWANLHGAVVIGAALTAALGAAELGRRVRVRHWSAQALVRPVALLVVPWLCVLATPYGFGVLDYYRSTIGNSQLATYITEWRSPAFYSVWGVPFYLLAFVAVFLVGRRPRRLNAFELLALGLTLGAGLLAVRSIVWFIYACTILLPALAEDVWPARSAAAFRDRDRVLRSCAAVFSVGLAVVFFARPMGSVAARWPDGPAAAVSRVLRADPQAKVIANDKYADWLLFRVPETRGRVAFDGRWEILSHAQMTRAMDFLFPQGASWDRISDGYRLLVLDPHRDAKLAGIFRSRGWHVLYRDDRFVVLDRGRGR